MEDYKNVSRFLRFLKDAIQKKSIESYNLIKNEIYKLSIPFPVITFEKGNNLFRARVHKENEIFFEEIKDLTHREDIENIVEFGRANEQGQSLFYCSDNQTTSYFEVTKIAREKYRPKKESTTIGVWQLQEDIRVGFIPVVKEIKEINLTANRIQNGFDKLIKKFNSENFIIPISFLDIFSNEFIREAKNNHFNYVVSCAFANYIFDTPGFDSYFKKNLSVDGILYSSVMHKEEGMNFALKPDVIYNNKIRLIQAYKRTSYKVDDNTYNGFDIILDKGINYYNGRIKWV